MSNCKVIALTLSLIHIFRVKEDNMKKFIALLSCMLFILGSIGTVFADENTTVAGSCCLLYTSVKQILTLN